MKSFAIIIALVECLSVMGKSQMDHRLVTRHVEADSPAHISLLSKRNTSSPNLMTCPANSTSNTVVDLEHCEKAATFMASNKSPCAKYKSCTLMTRADIGKPQAVQVTSPTELRYAFSTYFCKSCKVTRPINKRLEKFPKTADGDLYLTAALCDVSDPKCTVGDQVSNCSTTTYEELKNAPANLTEVPKIGANQESSY